jgi:hypothetical protein
MFLQLSSRDATIYVYKKTIFEISNESRKNNEDISDYTRLKLDIINSYIELYKTLLLKLINNDFLNNEKLAIIENIYIKLNNLKDKSKIKVLNEIIDKFYYQFDDDKYFFNSSELLVKKVIKNQDLLKNNYLHKFLSDEINDKLRENYDKFINWFIS